MRKLLIAASLLVLLLGGLLLGAGAMHLGQTPAKLTWTPPEFRSSLMTFAYKVYGNPKMENGRHFVSKITFKNAGQAPITDFAISYKIQDYIPWTDPEKMSDIPGGFSFSKLYYPRLPAEVTKLRTPTTCALEIRATWQENGSPKEETFKHDILLHPVNELTYSDLPASEVESWYDAFDTSDFAVSMVTPNDPVVNAYAAEITRQAGGTTAGIDGGAKEVYRICQNAYDYMTRTGLRYTGDSGVPASFDDVKTLAQSVRLPRDVIQNNNGLCIELAILWASVLEHLGVDAALVMVPGHCYVIAYSAGQGMPLDQGLPIECTSITPQAVGKNAPVSFADSVKMAVGETEERLKVGLMIVLPVKQYQQMGFTAPELPDVDVAKITEMLDKRLAPVPETPDIRLVQQNQPAPQPGQESEGEVSEQTQQQPATTQALPAPNHGGRTVNWRYAPAGLSIDFPANFITVNPPVNPGNVLVLVAGNPATTMECDVMHVTGTEDPGLAWQYIARSCARHSIHLTKQATRVGENGLVFYSGTTNNHGSLSQWVAVAKPIRNGVVFVSGGTNQLAWKTQYGNVMNLLSNVHFQ